MPSSSRQMRVTATAFSCVNAKSERASIARSTNSCIAAYPLSASGERSSSARIGRGQRRQGKRGLARHMERLAARRDDRQPATSLQEMPCQLRARQQQMLAIVEDEQERPVRDELVQRFDERQAGFLLDPERRRNRVGHEIRIRNRREVDEPDTIGMRIGHVGSEPQRQAGLADAADTDERHQPVGGGQHRRRSSSSRSRPTNDETCAGRLCFATRAGDGCGASTCDGSSVKR